MHPIKYLKHHPMARFFTIVSVAYLVSTFLLSGGRIQSGSMEPTLRTGSLAFYDLAFWKLSGLHHGDIVCFPYSSEMYSKRIIGLPGDTVELQSGQVFINGTLQDEIYLPDGVETDPGDNNTTVFHVPDDSIFVLGDNRCNSKDSRYWEDPYYPLSNIKGKLLIHLP